MVFLGVATAQVVVYFKEREPVMLNESDTIGSAVSDNSATYCPEDNKLRLYLSARVERDSYEYLRSIGYQATPKQDCAFAGVWSPAAEDAAFALIPEDADIGDEDYSPEDRAADRAERFSGYRDSRRSEAGGLADRYESGPSVFGNQNVGRAERQAARRDRVRDRALSQWSKAEYWQVRTQGVINHALHRIKPAVRRSRILRLEAELRKVVDSYTPANDPPQIIVQRGWDNAEPSEHVWCGKGRGGSWVKLSSLPAMRTAAFRWVDHYELRLQYERAMLGNEGGSAGDVEMIPGGFIGRHQVLKVNKSSATGRVVSVGIWGPHPWRKDAEGRSEMGVQLVNVERFGEDIYREPTNLELALFAEEQAALKKSAKAAKPKAVSLVNPAEADAERLQTLWNDRERLRCEKRGVGAAFKPVEVLRVSQAVYSANSKGEYAAFETRELHEDTRASRRSSNLWSAEGKAYDESLGEAVCKIRVRAAGAFHQADRVIVIVDKPQKPLPLNWAVVEAVAESASV
jgi:hypothetical protein